MKNEKQTPQSLDGLKKQLNFIKLDERLEMVKVPTLSTLTCLAQNNGCKSS